MAGTAVSARAGNQLNVELYPLRGANETETRYWTVKPDCSACNETVTPYSGENGENAADFW